MLDTFDPSVRKNRTTRIGVLGAGQLALMLAEAAPVLRSKLPESPALEILCAGSPGDCAGTVAPILETDLDSAASVRRFAAQVDLVTVESENIDARVLAGLNLFPNAHSVGIAQDRLLEKTFFHECGMRTAPFAAVNSLPDLEAALERLGTPAILKTRRMGYDGKGQVRLGAPEEAAAAWVQAGEVPCILEGMVRFSAEVSLLAARNSSGETAFYPLTENHHRDGILRTSIAPWQETDLQGTAEEYLQRLLTRLGYVGMLAVEFFVVEGGLVANEMAPRVHNSGHWTIEGAETSQFENHLRALLDLPLGSTGSRPTVMLNCIGTMPPLEETSRFDDLFRHDYGKEARPGRKVGHLTFPRQAVSAIHYWMQRLGDG